jgi:hypothetical protein
MKKRTAVLDPAAGAATTATITIESSSRRILNG